MVESGKSVREKFEFLNNLVIIDCRSPPREQAQHSKIHKLLHSCEHLQRGTWSQGRRHGQKHFSHSQNYSKTFRSGSDQNVGCFKNVKINIIWRYVWNLSKLISMSAFPEIWVNDNEVTADHSLKAWAIAMSTCGMSYVRPVKPVRCQMSDIDVRCQPVKCQRVRGREDTLLTFVLGSFDV